MALSLSLQTSRAAIGGHRVRSVRPARSARVAHVAPVRAAADPMMVISGCNAAMLGLGRFVFRPYVQAQQEKAGQPVQNGTTHFEAGDRLAEEASFITRAGADPAGFSIIDTLAWGSLGHVLGFTAIVLSNN
jgi:photosystem I subunit V